MCPPPPIPAIPDDASLCPECHTMVPTDDVHLRADLAICRACNTVFHPSEHTVLSELAAIAEQNGFLGIRMRQRNNGHEIRWYPGLQQLLRIVGVLNLVVFGGMLVIMLITFLNEPPGRLPAILTSFGWAMLTIVGFEAAILTIVIVPFLVFGVSRVVLMPAPDDDGFWNGEYYQFRFFRTSRFLIHASSQIQFSLSPDHPVERHARKIRTAITIHTDTLETSFGVHIPEMEQKQVAAMLWRFIHTHLRQNPLPPGPDTDDRLRCPLCDTLIPFDNIWPADDAMLCDACDSEHSFPPSPNETMLDEIDFNTPPRGVAVHTTRRGLTIQVGRWYMTLLCLLGIFGSVVLMVPFAAFAGGLVIKGFAKVIQHLALAAYRCRILLEFPRAGASGRIGISGRSPIVWDDSTHVSLAACYPSIDGTDHIQEICIQTGEESRRFGREMTPEIRNYTAAVLRAATTAKETENEGTAFDV